MVIDGGLSVDDRGTVTFVQRFFNKVEITDGCWNWFGGRVGRRKEYGKSTLPNGRQTTAHKVSYIIFVDDVPEGLELDHKCRNTLCVNPEHLEPVTRQENGFRSRKEYCHRGHKFDQQNTYTNPQGNRACRKCKLIILRRFYERRKTN